MTQDESFITMDVTGTNVATLTLNAREDGTPEQQIWYRLSNSPTDINSKEWQLFYDQASPIQRPVKVTGWNLGTDTTVFVQFKDKYDNITQSGTAVLDTPTSFTLKDGSNLETDKYRLLLIWDDVSVRNFSKYIVDRSTDGTTWESQHDISVKNGYLDVNLNSGQKYYYRVKTEDSYGNISRPTAVLMSQPGAAPDVTAKPTITMQNWKQEYGVRATVTWDTDQSADSFVVYSKEPLQAGTSTLTTSGKAAQVVGQFDKTLSHSVLVQQLDPSTKYYFKTLSQNEIKITGASDIVEMETPARIPLVISGVEFKSTTNTGTTVIWSTNKLSTSKLEYGTSSSYGQSIEDTNQNTDHVMALSSLSSGSTYHIRITSTDADGNYVTSDDYKVSIPATPTISSVSVTDIRFNQATINWQSNVPADSKVELTIVNKDTGESISSEQGQSDLGTNHAVTVIGLNPNTTYHFKVKSTDTYGNTATSEDRTFSTPNDTEAPIISNVKSEVTTSGAGENIKIMAIISWTTDEPATSQVEYGMGMSGTYPNKTDESLSLNMSHMVTIPDLRPNASYQYRIIAKDAAGNIAKGEDLSLITPPKDKSLLQMVLKSLEETFSWTKKIKDSKYVKPIMQH